MRLKGWRHGQKPSVQETSDGNRPANCQSDSHRPIPANQVLPRLCYRGATALNLANLHPKRRRPAEVRRIVDGLVVQGQHVIVLGDLNEGPATAGSQPANLRDLFHSSSPLVDCYELANFQVGNRPGTFDSCGLRNRLDYILISKSLVPNYTGGGVFRKGLWGTRKTRPTNWDTYPELTKSSEQASDHAAVFIDINL